MSARNRAGVTIERIRATNTSPAARRARFDAVVPDGVAVQVCPGYTHHTRVQCAPGEQPFGAGFAAAGAGIDITTGRPWAAPAKACT